MRTFAAFVVLAGALCATGAPAFADNVVLVGRITLKASASAPIRAPKGDNESTRTATTIALPSSSGVAHNSTLKKAELTCADLVVHVYSGTGVALRTTTADELPSGLCHYQVELNDPFLLGSNVVTVKVDSPHFKVAGSTQVHLNTAKGGFAAGDVTVARVE